MNQHLKTICDKVKPLYTETGEWQPRCYDRKTGYWSTNLSTIETKLIQDVGRFTEHYASDFLISWKTIQKLMETPLDQISEECKTGMVIIAIRQSGVDGETYLLCRTSEWKNCPGRAEDYYRKVYAVTWEIQETHITVMLKDIKGYLWQLCTRPADKILHLADNKNYPMLDCDKYGNPQTDIWLKYDRYARITKKNEMFEINVYESTPDKPFFQDIIETHMEETAEAVIQYLQTNYFLERG